MWKDGQLIQMGLKRDQLYNKYRPFPIAQIMINLPNGSGSDVLNWNNPWSSKSFAFLFHSPTQATWNYASQIKSTHVMSLISNHWFTVAWVLQSLSTDSLNASSIFYLTSRNLTFYFGFHEMKGRGKKDISVMCLYLYDYVCLCIVCV